MSIIAASATQPTTHELLAQLLFMAVLLVPGLILVWWTRAHRSTSIAGPLRVPDQAELWPIPVAVVIAMVAWIGSAVVYSMVVGMKEWARQAPSQPTADRELDVMMSIAPADFAFLAAVPPLIGLLAAAGFLMLVKPAALQWMGTTIGRLPRGVLMASVAAVFAVPATMFIGTLTELTYQWVGYQHPAEHELLKFMKEAPAAWIKWAAIAAAVLVAPLFEEFLFRGLIQTSLVAWFTRWGRQARPAVSTYPPTGAMFGDPMASMPPTPPALPQLMPPALPQVMAPGLANDPGWPHGAPVPPPVTPQPPSMAYALPSLEYETPTPARRMRAAWLGVIVTSVIFAVIHPLWTAPIIFFLSLALGYVYERTGNLWASILLHAIFNTVSTTFYLLSVVDN